MTARKINFDLLSDDELVARAKNRCPHSVRTLTTRHNQRLFRAAWSVLRHHDDAEDAVQEGYLKAFRNLDTYTGEAEFSTWLTRIVINAALDRKRSMDRRRSDFISQDIALLDEYREKFAGERPASTPEAALMRAQLSDLLKSAISLLPDDLRSAYVLRDLEEMSTRETASALEVSEDVVKSRVVRARKKNARNVGGRPSARVPRSTELRRR